MKFKRVLHPEIVLNLRGPKKDRESYEECFKELSVGTFNHINPFAFADIREINPLGALHLALTLNFRLMHAPVFHAGAEFLKAMQSIKRDFPLGQLPKEFMAYFSFAEKAIYDEFGEVSGAYIYIGPEGNTPIGRRKNIFGHEMPEANALWISYTYAHNVNQAGQLMRHLDSSTIASIFSGTDPVVINFEPGQPVAGAGSLKERELGNQNFSVFRTILNLVVYTFSDGAEFEEYLPTAKGAFGKKGNKKAYLNECAVPVISLNANFHKMHYAVESTNVRGHFRWQPCGENLSRVKLIWIDEHERSFKKTAD